ncbi:hypothetical protein EST38_g11366 [Candolleomyces aberdarensis]|uniref:F-box domain-containing protein n=1 Tax=Candolleomyces aberdarensis TaxID=2316362 RepID=A0A4Q2D533_9AGAR|nr:hypothetical protein EST38_g11366 [Candolleomyces aberdarensis]
MDIHLSHFYGTNHVPSDAELLEIEKLLAPHNARLSRLEKDLEEAEAKVARLKKEKEDVLRVIKPLKSLSSLIRRFPREVMELIFKHSVPPTAATSPNLSIFHAPLVLLRVCKLWREIALTTPQLWALVELTTPPHLCDIYGGNASGAKQQQRLALYLEQLDQQLELSESYPLSIVAPPGTGGGTIIRSLSSKVAIHSRRWEFIDFDASEWRPHPFADIVPEDLPSLKYARLHAYSSLSNTDPFNTGDNLSFLGILAAPNLKGLQIQVSRSCNGISKMPVNWTNLTHLSLDGSYMYTHDLSLQNQQLATEMLPVLNKCQNLRILSLLLISTHDSLSMPEPEAQVTLSKLEALNVAGCRLQIHHLLQSIETPRIRQIHYQPFHTSTLPAEELPFSLAPPLLSFLERYGNRTEVLSVNLPTVSREDLRSWLECTPALKQLTLGEEFQFAPPPPLRTSVSADHETGLDDSSIGLLTPKQDHPYLCPNLKIFRCSIKTRISVDTMLAFLKARTDPLLVGSGGIIEEVSVHKLQYDSPFGDSTDAEDEKFESIREAGVRLSFKKPFYYQSNPDTDMYWPLDSSLLGFGPGYGVDLRLFCIEGK